MIKIIVAPDSFKGTISATEYCDIAEKAILNAIETIGGEDLVNKTEVLKFPLADGGEGSAEAIGAKKVFCDNITNGDFEKITSYYSVYKDDTVIIEIASCASLPSSKLKNPELTTTYGVGELFLNAYNKGYRKFIFALGGSSTNDCACGFASAVGCDFYNNKGERFIPTGKSLCDISSIDITKIKSIISSCDITAMCDVNNPLYGENGAAYIFAGQKGADEEMIKRLDSGAVHFSEILKNDLDIDISDLPGGGAAGGFGAGIRAIFGASLESGINTILKITGFEDSLNDTDFVITGEGKFDLQSYRGKVIFGVKEICKKHSVPLVVVCGSVDDNIPYLCDGINSVFSVQRKANSLEESLPRNGTDLYKTVYNLIRFKFS